MKYRTPSINEAGALWEMMDRLDHETKHMLYEPGERKKDLSRLEALIRSARENGDLLLIAEADGRIAGYISAQKGSLRRTAHSAYIVVGILAEYRGQGTGTEFFRRLDIWARQQRISRLELTVVCENSAAVRLYEKSGFKTEGIKRNSLFVDGKFMDEFYMAKLL